MSDPGIELGRGQGQGQEVFRETGSHVRVKVKRLLPDAAPHFL